MKLSKIMMLMTVVAVLVVADVTCGNQPDLTNHYPGFTPITENCTQSLVELLLLRQEVHLSRLIETETAVGATITALAHTVTELRDAVIVRRHTQETLREECKSPWAVVGDNCLMFALGERMAWAASTQYCTARGGHLAIFHDANTFAEFINYINSLNTENTAVSAWVGGSDEEVEAVWQWIIGEPMPKGPPFWGSTNNYVPEPTGTRGENCAILYQPDKYYMHDITCTYKAAPLCQKIY